VKNREKFLDMATQDTRTLYTHNLVQIPKGTGLDERTSDRVNIKGWKLTINIQSLENVSAQTFCFAILSPKNSTSVSTTEFFRQYGADRAINFSTSLNYLQMMTNPINSDQYNILHRWRFKLGPKINNSGTSEVSSNRNTYKTINKYIKFNRQLRYETTASADVEADPVFLVWWADVDYSTNGGAVETANYQVQWRSVCYFNDTVN